jgi:hypothetical protein
MKTREFIKRLQEADPSGDLDCCIDNHDILRVERQFAFYDGALEILVRDPARLPYYEVIGGILRTKGDKIRIQVLSLEDAIYEAKGKPFPIEIECADDKVRERLELDIQRWRKAVHADINPNSKSSSQV